MFELQNCAEMERYLENSEQQTSSSSETRRSRSWTTFLSRVDQRPCSLPLHARHTQSRDVVLLPASFTLHRHSSTPSPTTSLSPFPLASPSSVGATTPDDDGSNPVDSLCQLNIDSSSLGGATADVVSSSSSTTSRDSTRSEPDRPIHRPTELPLRPGMTQWAPAARHASNKTATACFRRIAKRRMRPTADDVTVFPGGGSSCSMASPARATSLPVSQASSLRLPPLPSPAEMAYLRSVSGGVTRRSLDNDERNRTSTTTDSSVARGVSSSCQSTSPVTEAMTDNDVKKQVRVYGCSVTECGKLYSKSSHLKAHMRSHTGTIVSLVQVRLYRYDCHTNQLQLAHTATMSQNETKKLITYI